MIRNEHDWPSELEFMSACFICGLLFGEWSDNDSCEVE